MFFISQPRLQMVKLPTIYNCLLKTQLSLQAVLFHTLISTVVFELLQKLRYLIECKQMK